MPSPLQWMDALQAELPARAPARVTERTLRALAARTLGHMLPSKANAPGPGWLAAQAYVERAHHWEPCATAEAACVVRGAAMLDDKDLSGHLWPLLRLLQTRSPMRFFLVGCEASKRDVVENECKLLLSNVWKWFEDGDEIAIAVLPTRAPHDARVRVWIKTARGLDYQGEAPATAPVKAAKRAT